VTAVRILGIVAGIGLFLMAVRAYERRRISRLNLIVVTLLGTALVKKKNKCNKKIDK